MRNWEVYFHQPKSIDELMKTATVVVDTNVLLSVYQWRNVTVEEVLDALEALSNENRLKIPYQVVKEFTKRRPRLIKERIHDLEENIKRLNKETKKLNEKAPMFEASEVLKEAEEKRHLYNTSIKEYQDALKKLRDEVKSLFINDPYLTRIRNILSNSFFDPEIKESDEELEAIAEGRFENKIPPGYKDGNKKENNAGDYIIWHYILQMDQDVIFISNDKKPDWVYQDNHDNPISARRELIEEFYNETGGKDFIHLTPKDFVTLYNPDLSEDVKEDLNKQVLSSTSGVSDRDVLNNYIWKIVKVIDKYNPYQFVRENGSLLFSEYSLYYQIAEKLMTNFINSSNTGPIDHFILCLFDPGRINLGEEELDSMIGEIDDVFYEYTEEQ